MNKKQEQNASDENKKRLKLDDFKHNLNLADTQEALDAITGGILGACHDSICSYGGYKDHGGY